MDRAWQETLDRSPGLSPDPRPIEEAAAGSFFFPDDLCVFWSPTMMEFTRLV